MSAGNRDVSVVDPVLHELLKKEKQRQVRGLEMIASENFTSRAVCQALGSCMTNKYSEGQVGARYYGGNEVVDQMESLCKERALTLYKLSPEEWGVNVQVLSGSPANFAVYTALVEPHGRIMGLDLPDGGHLSHGFFTESKKVSATSIFFESMPYKVDMNTGLIDYDALAASARLFKPKMIVAGISCYARHLDYARFRAIADEVGAYLLGDMAHVSGLVAAGISPSPFEFCDVVTSTTHKTLRGPRSGIIFFRKGVRHIAGKATAQPYNLEKPINDAVFPGLQGGPHNNAIAGLCVALHEANSPEFQQYQVQVVKNCQTMCRALSEKGYTLVTGGSDNHLALVDFRPQGLNGARIERVLELVGIAVNKNTCPGDKSAFNPSGIRLGTPSLTTRGLMESDMLQVVEFLHRAVNLTTRCQAAAQVAAEPKKALLKDFHATLAGDASIVEAVKALAADVTQFALQFPMPGSDEY